MKCFNAILAGALIVLGSACDRGPKASGQLHLTEPEAAGSVDKDTQAQNRINSFFYVALVPKLQSCWNRVQGKGEITFQYTYRAAGTNWVWQQQEVEGHTLAQEQAAMALQCMQDAARGTSFPMEAAEAARKGNELVIHWTWPVPLPQDATVMGRMIGGGGGSGECQKKCVNCDCPFLPLGIGVLCKCVAACSGYTAPCVVDSNKKGCTMKLPECTSGRIGFGGSIVIARAATPHQSRSSAHRRGTPIRMRSRRGFNLEGFYDDRPNEALQATARTAPRPSR